MTDRPEFFGGHDAVLCDLDGVVYAGDHALDGAVETLEELAARGIPVTYVTNNASRAPEAVAAHLRRLGLTVTGDQVFSSVAAGLSLLRQQIPPASTGERPTSSAEAPRVLVVGSEYLRSQVRDAGYLVVDAASEHPDEHPDAVIQGFDPSVDWRALAEASYAVAAGARWVATNLDLTIPRAEGIAPGNGALVGTVQVATGLAPVSGGKPGPALFQLAADAVGARRPLVVGDRLDTDILGGNRAGYGTVLVLTGIDTRRSVAAAPADQRPRWIIDELPALLADPPEPFR